MHRTSRMRRWATALRRNPTPHESMFWGGLLALGLSKGWARQVQFWFGQRGAIVDFYHRGASLVVEIDGPIHLIETRKAWDHERDTLLRQRGIRVYRVTNAYVGGQLPRIMKIVRELVENPGRPTALDKRVRIR